LLQLGLDESHGTAPGASPSTGVYAPGPAAAPTPAELAAAFPQLEILELLGQGGMGAVYKARQPKLDRLVALKVLPPDAGRDAQFAERFLREARALARLHHPHIVGVHDFGETANGLHYFLMEYVDGVNLRQVLRAGRLPPEQALAIVPQVCEALHYAHQEGVVHRDVKPENILLDRKGRVHIADFGLAKLLGREAVDYRLTATHQAMGTPHYMAPEQLEKPLSVDHRADIYSLGVVFYEMLTGELPLGRFAPPSQKAATDVRLDDVVLRALEREPERRYQSISDVKTDVEAITASRPLAPPVPRLPVAAADTESLQLGPPVTPKTVTDIPTAVPPRSPWPFRMLGLVIFLAVVLPLVLGTLSHGAFTLLALSGVFVLLLSAFQRMETNPARSLGAGVRHLFVTSATWGIGACLVGAVISVFGRWSYTSVFVEFSHEGRRFAGFPISIGLVGTDVWQGLTCAGLWFLLACLLIVAFPVKRPTWWRAVGLVGVGLLVVAITADFMLRWRPVGRMDQYLKIANEILRVYDLHPGVFSPVDIVRDYEGRGVTTTTSFREGPLFNLTFGVALLLLGSFELQRVLVHRPTPDPIEKTL
jgi:tRNA A-37 threonylcarbamoyl transferase component Bud32